MIATATLFAVTAFSGTVTMEQTMQSSRPIWPAGRETEMNLFVGFRAVIEPPQDSPVVLRLTASSLYRATVNGKFIGHGPARGPHGFYRVDEWDLTPYLRKGANVIAVEVAGYNINSYYLLDQPAFLQAEVVSNGRVLASTGGEGKPFEATILTGKRQKVQRYSFQRTFSEVYRLSEGWDRWRVDPTAPFTAVECAKLPARSLLPRRVPYPAFDMRAPIWHVSQGSLKSGLKIEQPWKDRSLTGVGPAFKGYREGELETIPSIELQSVANAEVESVDKPLTADAALKLGPNSFHILDLGTNLTGTLGLRVRCQKPTRLFMTFDEVLVDGDVDFKRLGCVNVISLQLDPGQFDFESFEPYTCRYVKLIVLEGACEVAGVYLRQHANPDVWDAHFSCSDERLNRLFAAARETFAQNAVDVFMDCPSRERAGWLCDSFFTSRVAFGLSGDTLVEKNFYENFLLPPTFAFLPEGMLPMCYPGDHNDGVFIPNWAMWFVIELEEYLARSGDRAMVDALQPRVMKLLGYLKGFENSDGLLEKLPSWVFVEWSDANKYVQDVNYPSNMLYGAVLATAGRLYGKPELLARAEHIRETVRRQSFDGRFFVDNAVRKDGKLEVTRNRTEVCQYYAFFFETATPKTHTSLWELLLKEFGPRRRQTKAHPEIASTNQFPGNVMRLELLSRYGLCQAVLDESVDYNLYMADRTGTLWENDGAYASCNHGFASHVAHSLNRDVLGVHRLDAVNRGLDLRFCDLKLDWCEGRIPTPHGPVSVRWWKEGGAIRYRVDAPAGFRIETENLTGKDLRRQP